MNIQFQPNISGTTGKITTEGTQLQFNEGDVLRGEVVRLQDGQATLRLTDGSVLQARLEQGVALQVGDKVQLTVASNTAAQGTQVMLQLAGESQSVQVEVSRPVGTDSLGAQITALMRQYGMSPTQEGFTRVRNMMQSFPEMNMQTAVFLAANGHSVGAQGPSEMLQNLAQTLIERQDGSIPIQQPLDQLIALLDGLGEMPEVAQTAPASVPDVPFASQALTRYLTQNAPEAARMLVAQDGMATAATVVKAASGLPPAQGEALLAAFVQENNLPPGTLAVLTRAADVVRSLGGEQAGQNPLVQPQDLFANLAPNGEGATIAQPTTQVAPGQAQMPAQPAQAQNIPMPSIPAGGEGAAPPINPQATFTQAAPAGQAPVQPQGGQGQAAPIPANSLAGQLPQSPLQPLPAQGDPGAELARAVGNLTRNLGALRQTLAAIPGQDTAAGAAMQAQARAEATAGINQFTYVQIPIQMFERRHTADLYVLKRNRKEVREQDEYTIAIALETENMGRVEAVIKSRDRQVDVTFRMTPGQASDAVRAQFPNLAQSVREAGYELKSAILSRLDKPLTPQNAVQELSTSEETASIFLLDVHV